MDNSSIGGVSGRCCRAAGEPCTGVIEREDNVVEEGRDGASMRIGGGGEARIRFAVVVLLLEDLRGVLDVGGDEDEKDALRGIT